MEVPTLTVRYATSSDSMTAGAGPTSHGHTVPHVEQRAGSAIFRQVGSDTRAWRSWGCMWPMPWTGRGAGV